MKNVCILITFLLYRRFAFDSTGQEIIGVCVNNAYFRSEFVDDLAHVSMRLIVLICMILIVAGVGKCH